MILVKKSEKEITEYLRSYGIKPSVIRLKVLKELIDSNTHPTADRLFKSLSRNIPTLSKTSIYNTIKIFVDHGIVKELTIEDNEVRYDADLKRHGHFKCIKCGNITDVDMGCVSCNNESMNGAKVLDEQIYMRGICKNCLQKHDT